MSLPARMLLIRLPLQVVVSVLASLTVVWFLSEAIGFEFRPGPIGAISAALSASLIATELRGRRYANGA